MRLRAVVVRLLLAVVFFAAAVVRSRAPVVFGRETEGRETELVLLRAAVDFRAGAALLLADDEVEPEVVFFAVARGFEAAFVFLVVFFLSANGPDSYFEISSTVWPTSFSFPSRATSAWATTPISRPSSTTGRRRTWCFAIF